MHDPIAERSDSRHAVVGVLTHANLPGLKQVLLPLQEEIHNLDVELLVIDNASDDATKSFLATLPSAITVVVCPDNQGPGAGRNVLKDVRPNAAAYVFFDDDVLPRGGEVARLLADLWSHDGIGLVSGMPVHLDGRPMATTFERRPRSHTLPLLWQNWWGPRQLPHGRDLIQADAIGAAAIAIRGDLFRGLGGFEVAFWPGGFEDLDLCARVLFSGYGVVVDTALPIRQTVSSTMDHVLGPAYPMLRRSSGILFAAVDYPVSAAVGRLAQALSNAALSSSRETRAADSHGLLRCAAQVRFVLQARRARKNLRLKRQLRRHGLAEESDDEVRRNPAKGE